MTKYDIQPTELARYLNSVDRGQIMAVAVHNLDGSRMDFVGFYQGILDNKVLLEGVFHELEPVVPRTLVRECARPVPLEAIVEFAVHPRLEAGSMVYHILGSRPFAQKPQKQ